MKKSKKSNRKINFDILSSQLVYLLLIMSLIITIGIIKPSSLYIDVIIAALVVIVFAYIYSKESKNSKRRVRELSKSMDKTLANNLKKIDIPMVMVNSDNNKVMWENEVAKSLIPKEYVTDCIIELERKKQSSEYLNILSDIGNGTVYSVSGCNIRFSNHDCLLLSFIDRTEENKLQKVIENTQVTVCIAFIDNYEETLQGLDEIERGEITSQMDKILRKWVTEYNGIIAKLDKDKYAMFIEKQYIDAMEETKFDVLDTVKEITDKTKLPITISIGMSSSEKELFERYNASNSALDIALGRGGDQVVVKKDKKFSFYGGMNIGLEKTSRVRARTIASAITDIIDKCDKVYIMGHKNTDVDCIGAAVGIHRICEYLGKKSYIISDNKYNNSTKVVIENLKEAPEYEDVFLSKEEVKKHYFEDSLLIVVDTHKKTYLSVPELLEQFEKVVVIDHHRRGPEFIENAVLTYHEIYASSTSELVTELLMYIEDIKLTTKEAECLYAGILIDTKNFTFKTGVRTFEVAAYLKRVGLDIAEIKQIFQDDFKTYLAKVEIVKNAEIIDKRIAISICDETDENTPTLVAQAADELLMISGISASFVLCRIDNVIMISGRSTGDINVQVIMERLNGGGHLTFAGAQIAGVTIEEAKETLIETIEKYLDQA